jgi:hypothetical protein
MRRTWGRRPKLKTYEVRYLVTVSDDLSAADLRGDIRGQARDYEDQYGPMRVKHLKIHPLPKEKK